MWPGSLVSNQAWQQFGQTTSTSDWPWEGICHDKTDRSHLFLECVNGEAQTMCSKPLSEKGRGQGRFGVVKFVVDFAVEFWACQQRGSGGEKISARFSPSMTTVQWDPRKSPWISPSQNLFLTEIEFHGNFVCMRFSLQISPATFFATNFAGKSFCRHQFFAGAVFRRRHFFAGSIFRRTHPSCWAQKHQLGVSASFSKRQAKQPQATSMHPLVTGENFYFYSFIMTITIHSNFRILQPKFFAGVSLCRLVAIMHLLT